jgi:phthiocerol/phenolphthiocerol synthesis type-I polyketide synthase E
MSSAVATTENLAGSEETAKRLTRIWEDLLGLQPIQPDQNYFDLGGDSLLAVQMFAQIDKVFQLKLPVATLFEAPTITDLAQIVDREAPRSRWSSLVAIQPKGSRPPFFCMHGAGGNVLIYRELSKRLGEDQPFYGLQSYGLEGDSEPKSRIEEMAKLYVQEIRRKQPKGPYFLGGYCLGGTIAYEVAQQLTTEGEKVALLALFDTLNWSKLPPLTAWKKTVVAVEKIVFHALNYFRLDGPGKKAFLKEKIQAVRNRIPVWRGRVINRFAGNSEVQDSSSRVLGKIWSANDIASVAYIPKPYPGVVTDFRPLRQYSIYKRTDLKWEELAEGGQDVVRLPVYPAGMLLEPFVKVLAEALTERLEAAAKAE